MEESIKYENLLLAEYAWDIGLIYAYKDRNKYEFGSLFNVKWKLVEVWLSNGKANEEDGYYYGRGDREDNLNKINLYTFQKWSEAVKNFVSSGNEFLWKGEGSQVEEVLEIYNWYK